MSSSACAGVHRRHFRGGIPVLAGLVPRFRFKIRFGDQISPEFGHLLFRFGLGRNQVIQGWDDGVQGMKVGGRRRLTIPPHMGYGAAGAGGVIAPNETLVFVVDLLAVG